MLDIVTDFGFGQLPLERIYLRIDSRNERAMASYRKAGFVVEGVMRHDRRLYGVFRDSVSMSLLRGEWEAQTRRRSWEWAREAGSERMARPE